MGWPSHFLGEQTSLGLSKPTEHKEQMLLRKPLKWFSTKRFFVGSRRWEVGVRSPVNLGWKYQSVAEMPECPGTKKYCWNMYTEALCLQKLFYCLPAVGQKSLELLQLSLPAVQICSSALGLLRRGTEELWEGLPTAEFPHAGGTGASCRY